MFLIEEEPDKNSLAGMIFVSSVYNKGGLIAGSQKLFNVFVATCFPALSTQIN
jgi:hypothetical protein